MPGRDDVEEDDLAAGSRIAADIREIWRITSSMVGRPSTEKVTIDQYWILRYLHDVGPRPIKDIAAEVGVTHSPATVSVKRLEGRGLVRRDRTHEDGRIVNVRLTDWGKKLFESWRKSRRKELKALFDSLDDGERRLLLKLLDKILSSHKGMA